MRFVLLLVPTICVLSLGVHLPRFAAAVGARATRAAAKSCPRGETLEHALSRVARFMALKLALAPRARQVLMRLRLRAVLG